jgi:sugar phosphate isomerase/epimerase
MVIALLEAVPGIKLTLDYSHFICLGYPQEEIDPLAPYAAHVHLRQARPGALQTKMEEGTLNFFALFGLLKKLNYKGYIAFEAVHQNYMNTIFDDVLTEIVKMRDAYFEFMGQSLPKKVVNRY